MNTTETIIKSNRSTVFELFKYRCAVNPAHEATVIHEIEPRSTRPVDWWELNNMISLCNNCHMKIHSEGTKAWRHRLWGYRESVK